MAQADESWDKVQKQIKGALGCIAGLFDSWPGGLDGSNRRLVGRLSESMQLLLEDAAACQREQQLHQRLLDHAEKLDLLGREGEQP